MHITAYATTTDSSSHPVHLRAKNYDALRILMQC